MTLRRVEFVGPQVGKDLTESGILAMLACLVLIGIYIMFRFQWKFAVGAIVGVIHDPIITLGIFSEFGIPFDLSVVAGVLAITGYSLNDTIVIFDRMRENFRKARRGSVPEIMNKSINETLSRTLMTHGTTSHGHHCAAHVRRRGAAQLLHRARHRHGDLHLLVDLLRRQHRDVSEGNPGGLLDRQEGDGRR